MTAGPCLQSVYLQDNLAQRAITPGFSDRPLRSVRDSEWSNQIQLPLKQSHEQSPKPKIPPPTPPPQQLRPPRHTPATDGTLHHPNPAVHLLGS